VKALGQEIFAMVEALQHGEELLWLRRRRPGGERLGGRRKNDSWWWWWSILSGSGLDPPWPWKYYRRIC